VVECYSGATYAERPRALFWQGERLEVTVILASWYTELGKGFRVSVRDGREFELVYNQLVDQWSITPCS
jgi:hypothetical protein